MPRDPKVEVLAAYDAAPDREKGALLRQECLYLATSWTGAGPAMPERKNAYAQGFDGSESARRVAQELGTGPSRRGRIAARRTVAVLLWC
ncbi:MAG TPA: hypothetical protein VGD71_30420 [Kribbella sp.]|jgi:hypothetical protein